MRGPGRVGRSQSPHLSDREEKDTRIIMLCLVLLGKVRASYLITLSQLFIAATFMSIVIKYEMYI